MYSRFLSYCSMWFFSMNLVAHDQFADSLPCSEQEFIFIRIAVLREYLERELTMASLPFPFDIERSIDDWVFMCFFVGNDFLPHLPSLEIREGAIDRLVGIYKDVVHRTGNSSIIDFYPDDFAIDLNGKKYAWQGE
ncbi:UNVERIFIED_CONTAM: hypothetical protein FKN15_012896 [Acipenser sinensis]